MKNVHVLPIDKEPIKGDLLLRHLWKETSNECISWWRYNDTITIDGVTQYTTLNGSFRDITSSFKIQNIYITSDEEIKEDDWIYRDGSIHKCFKVHKTDIEFLTSIDSVYCGSNTFWSKEFCKKIILTTDQDLIKDGVQAIDDEFLEWFVKNPSCEEVDIKKLKSGKYWLHKIIIPKEEPKQHVELINDNIEEFDKAIKLFKQETLYDAFLNCLINKEFKTKEDYIAFRGAKFGAKWQQEQIGKSEFLQKLRATLSDAEARRLIFETFKNK